MSETPRVLLFDLYGLFMQVQSAGGKQLVEEALHLQELGVDVQKFWQKNRELRGPLDANTWDYSRYLRELSRTLEVDFTPYLADFVDADYRSWSQCDVEMVQWLKDLIAADVQPALLSNIPGELLPRLRAEQPWLELFQPALFSCDLGLAKPEAAIYDVAAQRLGVRPEDILFFDDTMENVLAARAAGYQAEHFVGIEPAREIVSRYFGREGTARHSLALECPYFRRGECASCSELEVPRSLQLIRHEERARKIVAARRWLPSAAGTGAGFRNKVKLVVSGSVAAPRLGIIDQDLRECPLPVPAIRHAIPVLAQFVSRAGLKPYRIDADTGVLKFVIVTASPRGELMVRFVVRRRGAQGAIFRHLEWLQAALPQLVVCSINVQPEHKAILEGPEEIPVTEQQELRFDLFDGAVPLHLRPQSFFQTNTAMSEVLYAQASQWLAHASSVWDLYCGVGGFALTLARSGSSVVGVELSDQAVACARASAEIMGVDAEFIAADAVSWAHEALTQTAGERPDAIVVNPPRRGLGAELAGFIEDSGVERVVYSSCNLATLGRDLAAMPSYEALEARVVEMFPHSAHVECMVLMSRVEPQITA